MALSGKFIRSTDARPTILRPGDSVEVEVHPDTVLASPSKQAKDISEKIQRRSATEGDAYVCAREQTHFQHVRARKGSATAAPVAGSVPTLSHFSIAQNGIGTRIQLRPAPAICAMSSSVMNVL